MRQRIRTVEDFTAWASEHAQGVAFVGPDPHHAIGLEPHLPDFRVVCADAPPALDGLRAAGVAVNVAGSGATADDARSTRKLLDNPGVGAFLNRVPTTRLLVFKTSYAVEQAASAAGWTLLAAPAKLSRRWENKLAFRTLADELGLPQPPGLEVESERADYDALARELGPRLVLQAPHGYSGARTRLVTDAASLAAAVAALRAPTLRATRYLSGRALTLNACVTARGVAVGTPFRQITGVPALTRYRLGSCGQDWSAAHGIDPAPFVDLARRLGGALAASGYRGVFGLDLVRAEDGRLYVIEVNPRLIASIALYTQLELMAGRLPLLARHVLAFIDPDADRAPLDLGLAPLDGSQLILHNVATGRQTVRAGPQTGVHRLSGRGQPRFDRRAYRVDAAVRDDELLVLAPAAGRGVRGGAELGRLQLRRGALSERGAGGDDGTVMPALVAAARALRQAWLGGPADP